MIDGEYICKLLKKLYNRDEQANLYFHGLKQLDIFRFIIDFGEEIGKKLNPLITVENHHRFVMKMYIDCSYINFPLDNVILEIANFKYFQNRNTKDYIESINNYINDILNEDENYIHNHNAGYIFYPSIEEDDLIESIVEDIILGSLYKKWPSEFTKFIESLEDAIPIYGLVYEPDPGRYRNFYLSKSERDKKCKYIEANAERNISINNEVIKIIQRIIV